MPETQIYGPAFTDGAEEAWREALAPTRSGPVTVNRGWDLEWERSEWGRSAAGGREHLSIRIATDEVVIGPRWVPGTDSGCAGCAEVRERTVRAHPLLTTLDHPVARPVPEVPVLPELLAAGLAHVADRELAPGEVYVAGVYGARRHRVTRSFYCPICGPTVAERTATAPPPPLVLVDRPAAAADPTRSADNRLLEHGRLRNRLVDARYGPVRAILRESRAPFAMSMAVAADAPAMGHGRARTFVESEPVAILEAYERLGGFPYDVPVVMERSYHDVASHGVDPRTLGRYTDEQYDHPSSRVERYTLDTPMDWVWGYDLGTGEPRLVPADVGFYQYEYRHRLDRRAARAAGTAGRRHYFHESSSGCAVGANLEEAALYSLFELAERDAFLVSWYRGVPLPQVPQQTITDPTSRALIDLIRAHGFDVHLLVATQDIALPVVWVLAVNRANPFPATFTSAGSGADPVGAVRSALREVAQLVTNPVDWTRTDVERMVADVWLVEELEDHVRYSSLPETAGRVNRVLGGPQVSLAEAFPDWPGVLRRYGAGDVRASLDQVLGLFATAGLTEVVLVDQSSREHRDAGIRVARAVVPGIVPMCFGQAHQRHTGLPRLSAAVRGTPFEGRPVPYDPHPFP